MTFLLAYVVISQPRSATFQGRLGQGLGEAKASHYMCYLPKM